jgi:cytochrome c556
MHRRPTFRFLLTIFVPAVFGVAVAADHDDQGKTEPQKARHHHYEELGDAFKAVRDNTRGDSPDWAKLEKAAQTIVDDTVNQQQWFAKGTGPESGKTRALPEIWSKPDDFTAAQKMFSDRAPKLLAAVKGKDLAATQAAFKDVGGACKNCHDNFRAPEDK